MTDTPLHVALHIGAHKTATTHLQRSLQQVRPALAAKGIRYAGPMQLRRDAMNLVDRFGLELRPGMPATDHAAALADMVGQAHRLALSEENFAGSLQNKWGNIPMPLYPDAPRRVSLLAEKIAPPGLHLHLGIRSPTAFLTSAYCQALMSGKVIALAKYKDKNPVAGVDWADLADRLLAAPGVASLTVWRQEDYAAVFPLICSSLLGADGAAEVQPIEQRVHQGLSSAAVEKISALKGNNLRDAARDVRAALPVSDQHPAFDAFDAAEHRVSDVFYAQQVARIALMPGLTFLRP